MDQIDFLNALFAAAQAAIQSVLLLKFFRRKPRIWLLILLTALVFAAIFIPLPTSAGALLSTLGIVLCCRFAIRVSRNEALLCGVLSSEIMWLCYGVFASLSSALNGFICFDTRFVGMIFFFAGNILPLAAYWLIFSVACKTVKNEIADLNTTLAALVPLTMIFVVEIYIVSVLYRVVNTELSPKRDIELLTVQLLGTASVFCILFAYKKCADNFRTREKNRLFEHEQHYRVQYANEIKAYYNTAKSLRHDFKNHILIINGLLKNAQYKQASDYISALDKTLERSELKFRTGCPILDIIFSAKLSGISDIVKVNCAAVPEIDEVDICTIFANALDNAIRAVSKCSESEDKFISVTTKKRGELLFIGIENSFDGKPFAPGIGLSNIIRTAEKYDGSAKTETDGNKFSLKIILCNSQQ